MSERSERIERLRAKAKRFADERRKAAPSILPPNNRTEPEPEPEAAVPAAPEEDVRLDTPEKAADMMAGLSDISPTATDTDAESDTDAEAAEAADSKPKVEPEPELEVPRRGTAGASKVTELIRAQAEAANLKPDEIKSLEAVGKRYRDNLETLEQARASKVDRAEWAELAQILAQAFIQLAAGMQGMKTGVDMSGLKFSKTDWQKRMGRINDEADRRRRLLKDKYGSQLSEAELNVESAQKKRVAEAKANTKAAEAQRSVSQRAMDSAHAQRMLRMRLEDRKRRQKAELADKKERKRLRTEGDSQALREKQALGLDTIAGEITKFQSADQFKEEVIPGIIKNLGRHKLSSAERDMVVKELEDIADSQGIFTRDQTIKDKMNKRVKSLRNRLIGTASE